jgi:hypothetical protein
MFTGTAALIGIISGAIFVVSYFSYLSTRIFMSVHVWVISDALIYI